MKKKRLIWQLPFLALLIVGSVIIIRQQTLAPYQKDSGFIFGTVYHVTYQSSQNYQKEIEAEMKKVDQSLSAFNKTSVVSKVNNNLDIEVDSMFAEVFNIAREISKDTDGAFDVTVAPLVNIWGFGFKTDTEPTKQKIDSIRQFVGYEKVTLKNNRIVKKYPQTMLDFSAIAKGFGSYVVARMLKEKGVKNYMVEIGGEIVASGVNERQAPWRIGINKPKDDSLSTNNELQNVIEESNLSMATSGNYRNFYYKNGKKYAHTIDPKTGYPIQHNLLSATVLAKDCAHADAYATAFMVMGMDGAKKILERHKDMQAYLIYTDEKGDNHVWCSPGLKEKLLNP